MPYETSNVPRPEHPRPDMERTNWLNLNGEWDFSYDAPVYDKKITVPFCYQSKMSGIGAEYERHDVVFYRRNISVPASFKGSRTLLHFGAVDFFCEVWLDGKFLGSHKGGYTPFSFDISKYVKPGEAIEHVLTVRCVDYPDPAQPRGKQSWKGKAFACWYAPVTGIWQTVWLEAVGQNYIKSTYITPDIDAKIARFEIGLNEPPTKTVTATVAVSFGDFLVGTVTASGNERVLTVDVPIRSADGDDGIALWSPNHPNLYTAKITIGDSGDEISTYFGMRKIETRGDMVYLNNHTITMKLILDQGYWSESLLTPPSDDALRLDVELTKKFGFNGARKHQKVEDPRYYYWADKLGLLVWGELPSAYKFCMDEMDNLSYDMGEMVKRDYNHPCIVAWTPLNESWGVSQIVSDARQQDFSVWLYYMLKAMDPTRLVSNNDGWELTQSDICSIHDYTAFAEQFHMAYDSADDLVESSVNGRAVYADSFEYDGEPIMLTEYAGIAFAKDATGSNWGYNGAVSTEEEFIARFRSVTEGFLDLPYMRGVCVTQLTDVFQEVNGLLDMDRNPKVPPERIAEIFAKYR